MAAGAAPMQGWQPASILNAREGHTATLLHSGRVLVNAGVQVIYPPDDPGNWQMEVLRTADLYHPDTNEWIVTGSMAIARFFHTATLLPDGTVLVVGGMTGSFGAAIGETEIYNPSTQAWRFTGSALNAARTYHAAAPLLDGKVLVAGGMDQGYLTSTEIYNPATERWTWTVNPLQRAIAYHTATLLSDGRVLVVGGWGGPDLNVELFDPVGLYWTPAKNLLSGSRYRHTATRLSDGKVLVAGGALARLEDRDNPLISCEIFDPVTGNWAVTGNLNEPRMLHTATLLRTGEVMIVGGWVPVGTNLRTVEFFNPATQEWTRGPDMSTPRGNASQTLLSWDRHVPLEFKVLVAGGSSSDGTNTLDSAELFTSGEVNV